MSAKVVEPLTVSVLPLATLKVPPPLLVTVSPLYVPARILPARVRFPAEVNTLALEKKLTLPVDPEPSVKLCLFVVPSVPLPVI